VREAKLRGGLDPAGEPAVRDRKAEHIRLALDERMQLGANGFDRLAFEHRALPEIDLGSIETTTSFIGRELQAPFVISCMTGGTAEATRINSNLARAAAARGIALGIGSQRRALEDPSVAASYRIRELAQGVPLLANLGAVQLNYGFGLAECRRAVEMIEADALVLHLNPLQEAIQPEGQCNFAGLVDRIGEIAARLPVPVVVKEVGAGIAAADARALVRRGVSIIDCAGSGGTSWARIEAARAGDVPLGELFADWGIPTPDAIRALREVGGLTIIGSGGLRHGLDAAKALALGADLAAMAYQFLRAAEESCERVVEKIDCTVRELRIAMFCSGSRTLADLRRARLVERRLPWPA
jgi:isopentenyl-diphosphate delta-isomerase